MAVNDQSRVGALAQQLAVGIAGHLGRTWVWRALLGAAAVGGLVVLAGSVASAVGAGL